MNWPDYVVGMTAFMVASVTCFFYIKGKIKDVGKEGYETGAYNKQWFYIPIGLLSLPATFILVPSILLWKKLRR